MSAALDVVDLTAALIGCRSVTPETGGALDLLTEWLEPLGFTCHRVPRGRPEAGEPIVDNLVAIRRVGDGPVLGFAGHVDVVPPGEGWDGDPFAPRIEDGAIVGRGACDMKGAIAAFVAAIPTVDQQRGTLMLLVTGDEEGPAQHGTLAIIDRLGEHGPVPDMIVIGEPTSEAALGDTVKIGRRGSVNMWIAVPGVQGHVAYPHLADNPLGALARIAARLDAWTIDQGNDAFPPSNLELTDIGCAPGAANVIPASAHARLNIRFNNLHRGADLVAEVERIVAEEAPSASVRAQISGEAFLTPPGALCDALAQAIRAETGRTPTLSTSGGTSDGRFLIQLCPVVDFGLPNATMHKVGERAAIADLRALSRIYARLIAGQLG